MMQWLKACLTASGIALRTAMGGIENQAVVVLASKKSNLTQGRTSRTVAVNNINR